MINKSKVVEFRTDFILAVKQLEEKYGVFINLGTISFNANELRAKMTAKVGTAPSTSTISKDDFSVGDVVFIVHKKVDPIKTFEIIKINAKNIKVRDRDNNQMLNVSPSLLKK